MDARQRLFFVTDFIQDKKFWEDLHESFGLMWTHVGADEECPTTGKHHYHVTLYFFSAKTLTAVVKKVKPRHVDVARGTVDDCERYATEDGKKTLELGQRPQQGSRNDLKRIHECIEGGESIKSLVKRGRVNNAQQLHYAQQLLPLFQPKRDWKPVVKWFWGPTETGKSATAYAEAGDNRDEIWESGRNLKWWQGYHGQPKVIIEDFRGDFCTFHELLRILDRYPYTVEVKNGSSQLLAREIWITSPFPPDRVYLTREDIGQLLRRIDEIREFT